MYPISRFSEEIFIWLPNIVKSGIELKRKAVYECLIDNRRNNTVAIQVRIEFYTIDGERFEMIPVQTKELVANNITYVMPDGQFIGGIEQVQAEYGMQNEETGEWSYSVQGIMPESEFYQYIGTQPISMQNMILQALSNSTKLAAE